ncbi:YoaK family protein [Streptomyces sp. NPDC049597]|uniref:YoaK family protein n=1 Tax=Streptomyces sp. NPDC049597 TaxID=3155276 RepID=UPI0034273435
MRPEPGPALSATLVALAFATGMIESVSFLALGPVFTAMQTGNVLFLGFAVAGEGALSPAAPAVSLAGFALGAVAGSAVESAAAARGRGWFVAALGGEAVLLGLAVLVAWRAGVDAAGVPLAAPHFAVIALVACAMGVRNVTMLRVHVPEMPTTLATRAMAGLFGGLPLTPAARTSSGARAEGRRAVSVGAMFAGALAGAWLLHQSVHPAVVLAAPAALVLVLLGFWAAGSARVSEPG